MDDITGYCAIKFGAAWCAPCKKLTPSFNKMENEFPDVKFHSINVDDNPELAKQYRIRSLPTVILLLDGREINRLNGAVMIEPLRKAFRSFVGV